MYKTIRVVNDIIEGMKTSAISSEAEKNRIAGEVLPDAGHDLFQSGTFVWKGIIGNNASDIVWRCADTACGSG